MSEEEYIKLYEKFLSGKCTPEEIKVIEEYRNDGFNLLDVSWGSQYFGEKDEVKKKIKERIDRRMGTSSPVKQMVIRKWSNIAAVLAMFILISIYFLPTLEKRDEIKLVDNLETISEPFTFRRDNATLFLANGTTIHLHNQTDGIISNLPGVTITKNKQTIIFKQLDSPLAEGARRLENRLNVPYGGQFHLVFTDGTEVWLNSGSEIRFPTSFAGDIRDVSINGEAYFEVAHEKDRPFVVQALDTQIDVLGTRFNIKAYQDESQIQTTLFQGSVQVRNDSRNVILQPGQKSITSKNHHKIVVEKANLREALAWKSEVFIFNNTEVSEIMKQISRWYDVEVEFRNDTESLKITGEIPRFQEVERVLKMLQLTGIVNFKINGRRIIVMT